MKTFTLHGADTDYSAVFPCISLKQPWASFVMWELKTWETRSRNLGFPIGAILIHASQRVDAHGREVYERVRSEFHGRLANWPRFEDLTRGAILGHVDVRSTGNFVPANLSELEKALGDFTEGRWFTKFTNANQWDRGIPCAGQLGIWKTRLTTSTK